MRHPIPSPSGPALRCVAVAATLVLLAATARAEQSPWYAGAGISYLQDDNLLRLGNEAPPQERSKSDRVTTTSLLAGFDQHLGRQRAYANLSLRDVNYARNKVYDNKGYTATAGLDWSTAERVSGSLSGTANRGLASFYSTVTSQPLERNIQNTRALNASVNVGLVTEYSLFTNLGHRQLRNDTVSVQNNDFDQDNGSLGLRWQPRAQTTLGLAMTSSRGRYPRFKSDGAGGYLPDRFKQSGFEFTGQLQPSGASVLDARLGYSKTRYDLNSARDFAGVTGTLGWTWQPRAKTRLSLRYTRDTGQNSYAVTLFDPVNGFTDSAQLYSQLINLVRIQADYEIGAKVSLTSGLQYTQRTIATTVTGNRADGKDGTTTFQLGVRWVPLRSVTTGCDLTAENRTASGTGTVAMKDNIFSCYAQFQLQP